MSATVNPPSEPAPRSNPSWGSTHVIDLLRIGVGAVWLVNLIFIADPQNRYWTTFSSTALSFAPTSIGGPGLAEYVAAHPLFFAWGIALITGYLAIALLLGVTTRIACFIGSFFSAVLLATQFGSTFLFPGGTDVGAHPLYIVIYAVLVVGGAGQSLSLDHWLRTLLAQRRKVRLTAPGMVPHPWTTAISPRTLFVYFVAGTLISLGVGFGLVVALPPPAGGASTGPSGPTTYVNLSISINPLNGWPQYSPANFTVPSGEVVFTITDHDAPMNFTPCPCLVTGTVGSDELVNGTPFHVVSSDNVAHSFGIPNLGLNVYSPGQSVVQFEVDLLTPGSFEWFCFVPCGTGADAYSTPPMGVAGYMTGTMTVT
ncbi:MAG: hypothetical protein L3K02_01275 [Thermoplasmata archaeon]|nr:hypothetical protein [Thermoplasmata archaeon]